MLLFKIELYSDHRETGTVVENKLNSLKSMSL